MKIKSIIQSQELRHQIMRLGKFLPDSLMISLQYRILLGRWPNLKHPKRFTEWIQYYKMHYRNPEMLRCVDKYEVRSYVEEKGYGLYLNKLYQICKQADDIEFEKLPEKFVIKTTSGGNGDNIMIVTNKQNLDIPYTIHKINSWLKKNYSDTSREWAYISAATNPQIIVEKYLENYSDSLDDYKFLCFNGKFHYLWVDKDRYKNHRRGFWDKDLNFLSSIISDHPTFEEEPVLPDNISDMIELAEQLAKDFPFVRVDLYNVKSKIYLGEITFYPWSGYIKFYPDLFDYELGKYFPTHTDHIWTNYIQDGK